MRCAKRVLRRAREVDQGGHQVEERHRRCNATRADPRAGNDQRNANGRLEEGLLEPHAALAHHVAVIRCEDHDRVFGETGFGQSIHQAPEHRVDVRDHPVIAAPRTRRRLRIDLGFVLTVMTMKHPRLRVSLIQRNGRDARRVYRSVGIEIPPGRRRDVGVVRLGQRDGQQERTRIGASGPRIDLSHRVMCHVFIIVDLHGPDHRPGIEHAFDR